MAARRGANLPPVSKTYRRTRGPASAKFKRKPPGPAEQAKREAWGREYAAIAKNVARQVREGEG